MSSFFLTIMFWAFLPSQSPSHPKIARRTYPETSLESTPLIEKSTQEQSTAYTKLAAGVAIGLGLPVFAALWALAFVLWGRRKRKKCEETHERDFVSMSDVASGNTPAVPEKDLNWMIVRPLRCYPKNGRERWYHLRPSRET